MESTYHSQNTERRSGKRVRVDFMVNKFIDGYPYACRAVDISKGGMLVEKLVEPLHSRKAYPVEIGLPGTSDRIWVWARQVHTKGRRQALRFTSMDAFDQMVLTQYLLQQRARRASEAGK